MPFLVLGINHRSAPVELREQVVFAGEELGSALTGLRQVPGVREAVIVSTCNRTELYVQTDRSDVPLGPWLETWHDLAQSGIRDSLYEIEDSRAIGHLFSVASGLDSMILGEPQILGQMKDAY